LTLKARERSYTLLGEIGTWMQVLTIVLGCHNAPRLANLFRKPRRLWETSHVGIFHTKPHCSLGFFQNVSVSSASSALLQRCNSS